MSSQSRPEPEMEIEVTELGLRVGAVLTAADVLEVEDLRTVCRVAREATGRPDVTELPNDEAQLHEILIEAVVFLRDNDAQKLPELAKFANGIIRERFTAIRANARRVDGRSA
jgi:hypothetical protein